MNAFRVLFSLGFAANLCARAGGVEGLEIVDVGDGALGNAKVGLAISERGAFVVGTNGAVSRYGPISDALRFGTRVDSGSLALGGIRSLVYGAGQFFVGGSGGTVAIGTNDGSSISWKTVSTGLPESLIRLAQIGTNLVATTGGRSLYVGRLSDSPSFKPAGLVGAGLLEAVFGVSGFDDGTGAVLGNSGMIRYSVDSGNTWWSARLLGASSATVTDAVKFNGRVYATQTDGSVVRADVPADPTKGSSAWTWTTAQVVPGGSLRSIAYYDGVLVAVGDAGAAYVSPDGVIWQKLAGLPASAVALDYIGVEAPSSGELRGALVLAAKSGLFVGTPVPAVPVLVEQSIDTCSSNAVAWDRHFLALAPVGSLSSFLQVDWMVVGNRAVTNNLAYHPMEARAGSYVYEALARDYRSGVQSGASAAHLEVKPTPADPVALLSVVERCVSDAVPTLSVSAVTGVRFEWYAGSSSADLLGQGTNFTPSTNLTAVFYVQAIDTTSGTHCLSVGRTRIDYLVWPNPLAPVAVQSLVEQCDSDSTATLAVSEVPGIKFRWYDSPTNTTALGEASTYVPAVRKSASYYVEAYDPARAPACPSVTRTRIDYLVWPNPAAPVAVQVKVEQCDSDAIPTLAVAEVTGIKFRWYESATGGTSLAEGATYVPAVRKSGAFYVEAYDPSHTTACPSVTRTRIDYLVWPNPAAPAAVASVATIAACESIPTLAVQPEAGVSHVWYSAASGGVALTTNSVFTPTEKAGAVFHVESVSDDHGCRSLTRTAIQLVVHPAITLNAGTDQVVRHLATNKVVELTAAVTPVLESYHTASWKTSGDGVFLDAGLLGTTYTPGTNDLAGGDIVLTLAVAEKDIACSATSDSMRLTFAKDPPTLAVALVAGGKVQVTWVPAPGYVLRGADSVTALAAAGPDLADGRLGLFEEPASGEAKFYMIVEQ